MEWVELVKLLGEILKNYGGYGLFLILFCLSQGFLVFMLWKQHKERAKEVEKFATALAANTEALKATVESDKKMKWVIEELDTDVHDLLNLIDREREISDRVTREVEQRLRQKRGNHGTA